MGVRKLRSGHVPAVTASQYVGIQGTIFWDDSTGALRLSDGVTAGGSPLPINIASQTEFGGIKLGPGVTLNGDNQIIIDTAGLNFAFGDFYAFTNNGPSDGACLSSVNADQDVNLVSNGIGKVNIVGEFNIHKTNSTVDDALASGPIFSISSDGFTTINIPVLPMGTSGLLINGNGSEPFVTTVPGVTLRTVGNDGSPNTVAVDAHGTGAFSSLTFRASRGTGNAPTQVKSGDTIGRITGVGFGNTVFVTDPVSGRSATDIRFVATEDFTDARSGTKIDFYTSPNGGTVRQLSASIGPTGITANLTGNVTGNITGTAPAGSLTGTTLASNVVTSSLTSVGTLGSLAVTGQTTLGVFTGRYVRTTRDAGTIGDNGTVTIDFLTDAIVYFVWGNGVNLAYSNYTEGRIVKVIAKKATGTGTDSINLDGLTAGNVSSGATSITCNADQSCFVELTCTGTTIGSVYAKV